jgi:hypothetical protein
VTAKTKDGKEVFKDSKIYMPQSTNSHGGVIASDATLYGAHYKVGIIADTSLQPLQTRVETFEFRFPYEDIEKEGEKIRVIKAKELDVTVALIYQYDPAIGEIGKDSYILYKETKTVKIR